jgi:purine-binding chemotaxis protein CheW
MNMSSLDLNLEEEDEIFAIGDAQQYLFFKSGGAIYAIDVADVSEMIEYQAFTRVPMMQDFIKGVTNIRGSIVAVVDLLERFGLGKTDVGAKTSMIIVRNIALIIDEVHDVSNLVQENIKDSLEFGCKIEQRFIRNMAKYNEKYIAILNCDEILNISELSMLKG